MQRLKIWPTIFTNVYPRGFEPKQSYTVVLLCRCFTSYMEINIFVLFPQGDDLGGDQAVPLGTRLQLRASINTFSGISKAGCSSSRNQATAQSFYKYILRY